MKRGLGEIAECMKVLFLISAMGESKNKLWYLVCEVRKPQHPRADMGAETRLLGFCKNARNQETLLIYSIITIICFKGSIYLKSGTLYPLRFMNSIKRELYVVMHVSLLFKMYDSFCHIKGEFGRNSQDGHCAFKIELVRHHVNFPCHFFYSQRNIWLK